MTTKSLLNPPVAKVTIGRPGIRIRQAVQSQETVQASVIPFAEAEQPFMTNDGVTWLGESLPIRNLADGTIASDAVTYGQWDTRATDNETVDDFQDIRLTNLETSGGVGGGDVIGPAVTVDQNIAVFNTVTGKLIKDGGKAVSALLDKSGGTMTGQITLPGGATGNQAISYTQATGLLGAAGSGDIGGPSSATNLHIAVYDGTTGKLLKDGGKAVSSLVDKAGDTMTGQLTLPGGATGNQAITYDQAQASVSGKTDAAYVNAQDALKVTKAGDTMTGLLTLSANPTAALGAATKQYVDSATVKPPSLIEASSANVPAGATAFFVLRYDSANPFAPANYTAVAVLPAHGLAKTISGQAYEFGDPVLQARSAGVAANHVAGTGTWANHPSATAYSATDDTAAFKRILAFAAISHTPIDMPIGGMRIVSTIGVTPFDIPHVAGQTFHLRGTGRRSYFLLDGPFSDYFLQIHQTSNPPSFGTVGAVGGPSADYDVPGQTGAIVLEDIAVYGAGHQSQKDALDHAILDGSGRPLPPVSNVSQKGILFQRSPHIQGMRISGLSIYGVTGTGLCIGGESNDIGRETLIRDVIVNASGSYTSPTINQPAFLIGGPDSGGPNNLRGYEIACTGSRWIGFCIQSRKNTANDNHFEYVRMENCWGPAMVFDGGVVRSQFLRCKINSSPDTTDNIGLPYVQFLQGKLLDGFGTAQAGSLTTITLATSASITSGAYNDMYISLRTGTGAGQMAQISAYSASRVATIYGAWAVIPDNTTTYQIGAYSEEVEWSGNIDGVPSGMLIEGGANLHISMDGHVTNAKQLVIGPGVYGDIFVDWNGYTSGHFDCDPRSSLYVKGSALPAFFAGRTSWVWYNRLFRQNDLARPSTTTASFDPDLRTNIPAANTKYLLRWHVKYWATVTAGFRFSIVNTGTTTLATTAYRYRAPGDLSVTEVAPASGLPVNVLIPGTTGYGFVEVEVSISVGAASGAEFRFNWAQNVSSATPTVVLRNSVAEVLRLAP